MATSVFDLFKNRYRSFQLAYRRTNACGTTVCHRFKNNGLLARTQSIKSALYGSPGGTGKGHGSDKAILSGLPGEVPNAMGSVKPINVARMALRGDGRHHVSLDNVIKTMRDTGADMKTKYKETWRGGLAVNVIEC
ncbi:L-serine deaminase [Glaciimonas immobilis]|uniref:L-serine ammonia-lyase n=1 Tax=Glaciimonas immobilis TaxID=728004 RepID=A0A840RTS8_9BURK|nr:L-serine deaminase [Glaciimonas immobilis]